MGAHGTLEEALANVASFATASQASKSSGSKHSSSKSSKHKSHKKHKKSQDGSKDSSKNKKASHKKRKKASSSSDESSGDDAQHIDLPTQLAKGREAARVTRRILTEYSDMRADLRELLARIDGGAAFAIDQIPVKDLQHLLASLFENLLLKKTNQADASQVTENSMHPLVEPPANHADVHKAPTMQLNSSSNRILCTLANDQEPHSGPIGPSMPPAADSEVAATSEVDPAAANADADNANQPMSELNRVAIGPAAPPPELLAAAAQLSWEEDKEDVEDLIGPAPPEMAEELDGVGGDERVAEVARVIRLLSNLPAGQEADAYDVLGVEPSATSGEIKKRYWRLSLLIHPDKCAHPRANDAFQAVSKVSKELQDVSKRKAIDDAREDARLFKIASELADDEEHKRQWRVARGEATAEDLAGPVRRGPQPRDSWMTDLPPERVPTTLAPQGNQNTFSQKGIRSRGDTSDWTMTPAQRLLQLQGGSAGQIAIAAGPSWEQDSRKAAQTAAAVDAYLGANRKKSLVEQHNEKKVKKRKAAAVEGKSVADRQGEWEDKHPWRPFDREKDLNIASKPANKDELLKQAGSLTGRFGGNTTGQRTFL
ncbi:MAG: hypothetical protein FRX49_11462 [Trebouxia sp. A1-2]|nr:MAG: hypothetical protein FRX49_11462 [Trebouxia sp. A1-2]